MLDAHHASHFAFQVAVMVLAAKSVGLLAARGLKQPSALGEISAGMLFGPHALGGIVLFGLGPLFPVPVPGGHAGNIELHTLSLLASAILLFHAGLETDVQKFLKYSFAGVVTGVGGGALSFALGCAVTVWTGFSESYTSPTALVMGAVATSAAIGITARVLSDRRKMDTAEGATILSGAVVQDIASLVLLGMALTLIEQRAAGVEGIPWATFGGIAARALLFLVAAMGLGILFARQVGTGLRVFGDNTSICTVALGLALLLAALAERSGLALIIGAYIVGVSLSQIDRAQAIQDRLKPVYDFLVPIFFFMIGMSVDFRFISGALALGLAFSVVCVVGKVIGCGAAALPIGFNVRGAARVGVGMTPRQEVGLVIAGAALAADALTADAFGGVVVAVFLTTMLAPAAMAWLFDDRSGLRREEEAPPRASEEFFLGMPSPDVARLVAERLVEAFRAEGFFVHRRTELEVYEMRKGAGTVFLTVQDSRLVFHTTPDTLFYARMITIEEVVSLQKIFSEAASSDQAVAMRTVFLPDQPEV